MIDNKKIEDAAKVYMIGEFYDRDEAEWNYPITNEEKRNQCIIDFKAGARWAINEFLKDLWHPASEIPCEGKYLVVEYNVTDTIKDYLSFKRLEGYLGWNWIPYCKSANVTQWLYVDELLPKKGCEQ